MIELNHHLLLLCWLFLHNALEDDGRAVSKPGPTPIEAASHGHASTKCEILHACKVASLELHSAVHLHHRRHQHTAKAATHLHRVASNAVITRREG